MLEWRGTVAERVTVENGPGPSTVIRETGAVVAGAERT